jgi:uncharacterized membrane protein
MRAGRTLKVTAVTASIAAYAGFSHHCNADPGARGLGAALAVAPLSSVGFVLLRRSARPFAALALALIAAGLVYACWPLLEQNFSKLSLIEECGLYGVLALGFGRSLRASETPYCTRLADSMRGPLTPLEIRYTRQVTLAWALFFAAITLTMAVLFVAAPLKIWSVFVNFCALPLVAAMFIGEHAVRRRVLPHADGAAILATVRAFLANPR